MQKSETIGKLSDALCKAQKVIEGAKKDSENPYFKSKYADLSSVWEAIKKPLTDNNLAIIQGGIVFSDHPDYVAIETLLTHSSGEWVSCVMSAKPVKQDSQSVGSCVTYLRRYGLAAITGCSPEDDDGEAATKEVKKAEPKPQKNNEPDVPLHIGENEPNVAEKNIIDFQNSTPEDKVRTLTILGAKHKYTPKKVPSIMTVDEQEKYFRFLLAKEK